MSVVYEDKEWEIYTFGSVYHKHNEFRIKNPYVCQVVNNKCQHCKKELPAILQFAIAMNCL